MKLNEVDLTKMLPSFMREDKYDVLLAEGMSNYFQLQSVESERVVIVGKTDYLNEAECDQLAQDMNIFWYSNSAALDIKRKLIKDAPLVFNKLGTAWAVEKVVNSYLEDTELQEWFDYGGDPHHFRLLTNNTHILSTDLGVFLEILDKVKRRSQWLESIILELRAKGTLYPAVAYIERSIEEYHFN